MIVLPRISDTKIDRDLIEKRGVGQGDTFGCEVGPYVKYQLVATGLEFAALQQGFIAAAVGVCLCLFDEYSCSALACVQIQLYANCGFAMHGIEYVRGKLSHVVSGGAPEPSLDSYE